MTRTSQTGLVMIAMLLLVFMAGTSMFFVSLSDRQGDIKRQVEYNREMVLAKNALITYATNFPDFYPSRGLGPGRLPCPDADNDGLAETSCTTNNYRRYRLPAYAYADSDSPFYTSDPDLSTYIFSNRYVDVEASGEVDANLQLWYSVSTRHRFDLTTNVHSDRSGQLSLDGESDYVAVIFAPGDALETESQERDTDTKRNQRANYLDQTNTSSINYISSYSDDPAAFNDKVIGITRTELMTSVIQRVAKETIKYMEEYHTTNAYYPSTQGNFRTLMRDEGPLWFDIDNWDNQSRYSRISTDSAELYFDSCENMVFDFQATEEDPIGNPGVYSYEFSRSGNTC